MSIQNCGELGLKFLGQTQETKIDAIASQLKNAVEPMQPFEVTIGDVGAFPNFNRPRVLWVGTNGGGVYKIVSKGTDFSTVKKKSGKSSGLSFNSVRAFLVDNKNKLWVGGHSTVNICDYQPDNFKNWEKR